MCGGAGAAFALAGCWGRVSPAQAASPRHPVSLSRLEMLSFGGTVAGRRAGGARAVSVTHDCVTDSLPGAADTNHNYKTQPESLLPTSDISGDNLSDHSPVTDLNTASGGR